MGRQHCHPRARRACLRYPVAVRAGHRSRAAPPVLRSERARPVQHRIRRRARHSFRLHRQASDRAAAAAARDGPCARRPPRTRRARDPLPARAGLSRRAAAGTADRRVQRRFRAHADAGDRRPDAEREPRHHRRRRGAVGRAPARHPRGHAADAPDQASAVSPLARPRRAAQAAPVRPVEADHPPVAAGVPRVQGRHVSGPAHVSGTGRHGVRPHHPRHQRRLRGQAPDPGGARPLQPHRLHRPRQLHHLEDRPLADRPAPLPPQLGDPRQ